MSTDTSLYIGLISGTSIDAVDAALVDFSHESKPHIVQTHSHDIPPSLKQQILSLFEPGDNEIDRLGILDNELGKLFAQAAVTLVEKAKINKQEIKAIGSHGQTVRHRPHLDKNRFTLQIADPNVIAQTTGLTTVADFRRRDMACGGEGAPLAPGFHHAFFSSPIESRSIVNIGGLANLSYLDTSSNVIGFDTGPGNGLMDAWTRYNGKGDYDKNGQWAATGLVNQPLLEKWLSHPYFQLPAPKSTGKEEFSTSWLFKHQEIMQLAPADVQATLLALSTESIAQAIQAYSKKHEGVYLCGGGAHNIAFVEALKHRLPERVIDSTATLGVEPDWVEAATFAWLAMRRLQHLPGNIAPVTGAHKECILGAIYPAVFYKT